MPSYSEIMRLTGLRSKNAVFKFVKKMQEEGLVEKDKSGRLVPGSAFGAVNVLGSIKAGFPSGADEAILDTLSLDDFLISNKSATYLLEVSGDSMVGAGIMPGDRVLAERGKVAKNGSIVIAEVDGEWTIKYLRKQGSKVWLEPANKKYHSIYPSGELNIAAVVTGVIRRYF